jgi:CRP/FNR family transcriptional regulator, cyclic AMP receptor protein
MAVSSPDLKAFLVATPFFGGLSDASLDLLVSMLVERRFDVGATVVAEGEPGRSMIIVQSGELVVSKLGDSGRVFRMAGLEPGNFFGEMTLIEMQNRSATVVAESPGPKPLQLLQGRHPRVCDADAEYQPRALSAAPPRRQSHC